MPHKGIRIAAAGAVVAVAGTALATVAASGTASAQEPGYESTTVYADVDGDGKPNAVTVNEVSPNRQALIFAFAEDALDVSFEADTAPPLQPPRVVDVDADGRDEVVVAKVVGANTLTFTVWKFDQVRGIVPLTTNAGGPFDVFEGGGIAAVSGYTCATDHDGRQFVTVNAHLVGPPSGNPRYDGERTSYKVTGNSVTVQSVTPIRQAGRDDPLLVADPATCAS
ncbi:hypothetical protein EV193_107239 [Herbihabitans rhizosphaerae]|uniref:VCBS repeat protein n=1 Tax=Herbihabitans rhizosphaerae TaxID=1872711 RepID=A0A4Q7KJ16_9PSEU|nr:hypothetical protein [Herbihabitans rhizosphaerae]RZS36558.1 hypothetical protein EV193_107239 [Herbihabitans rhizosphaerae]